MYTAILLRNSLIQTVTSIFHSDCGDEKCRPAVHCTSQFFKKKGLTTSMKRCKLDKREHGLLCKDVCKMNGPKVSAELIHTAGFGSGGLTLVKPYDASRQVLS